MKRRILLLVGLLVLFLLPVGSAMAAPELPRDRIVTGNDYVLKSGSTERGNVVVFGGSADIREGSFLDGDLIVFGGDVTVDGSVNGNVVVLGGDVAIGSDASVSGDAVLMGGSIEIDESAEINGDVVTNPEGYVFPFERLHIDEREMIPDLPEMPEIPAIPTVPHVEVHHRPGFAGRVGGAFLWAVGIGTVTLLLSLFWPKNVDQVRKVIEREPAMSGVLGFVTLLAASLLTPVFLLLSIILILVCLGLLGFPLVGLVWLAILIASLFGWAALGQLAGRWIAKRLSLTELTSIMETGLGAFSLWLVLGILDAIPLIRIASGFLQFGILCVGLGAVLLTRFGRRDYRQGLPILPVRQTESPSPESTPIMDSSEAFESEIAQDADPETKNENHESPFDAPPLELGGPFPEE